MAKTRKPAAKAKKAKRRTKPRKSKFKRLPPRKSRRKARKKGIAEKVMGAVDVLGGAMKETAAMRRKMGTRGGLGEG